MSEYVIEMQVRYRLALACVVACGWLCRLGIARLFGRERVVGWAMRGFHHFTAYRIRHVSGGGWGRWHRGLMSVDSPDGVFWRFVS